MKARPKLNAVIIDIDGTLADNNDAIQEVLITKDFVKFRKNILSYPYNVWCVKLTQAMAEKGYQIICITGREDTGFANKDTLYWLGDVLGFYPKLRMRPMGDQRKDSEIKEDILKDLLTRYDILFAVDDLDENVTLFNKYGIRCLKC